MEFTVGNHMTTRDQNGYPIANPINERLLAIVDKIIDLEWNNEGGCQFPSSEAGLQQIIDSFSTSRAVMKLGWFSYADKLRDMKEDYGIIPYPKYDEDQENYLSLVHDATTMWFFR